MIQPTPPPADRDWRLLIAGQPAGAASGRYFFNEGPADRAIIERRPYGVVARIIPYNHPLFFAAGKIARRIALMVKAVKHECRPETGRA